MKFLIGIDMGLTQEDFYEVIKRNKEAKEEFDRLEKEFLIFAHSNFRDYKDILLAKDCFKMGFYSQFMEVSDKF